MSLQEPSTSNTLGATRYSETPVTASQKIVRCSRFGGGASRLAALDLAGRVGVALDRALEAVADRLALRVSAFRARIRSAPPSAGEATLQQRLEPDRAAQVRPPPGPSVSSTSTGRVPRIWRCSSTSAR